MWLLYPRQQPAIQNTVFRRSSIETWFLHSDDPTSIPPCERAFKLRKAGNNIRLLGPRIRYSAEPEPSIICFAGNELRLTGRPFLLSKRGGRRSAQGDPVPMFSAIVRGSSYLPIAISFPSARRTCRTHDWNNWSWSEAFSPG